MRISWLNILAVALFFVLMLISALQILDVTDIIRMPEVLDFLNLPSVGIIIGGVMLHVMISYPFKDIANAIKSVIYIFSESAIDDRSLKQDRAQILRWQQMMRENRTKSRSEIGKQLGNSFEGYLFTLINTNYPAEEIRELGEIKIEERYTNNLQPARVYQTMGTAAPAFGMLGTLLGLIIMLANFQDAEQLGLGLSFALMTTLYGLASAHLLLFPMSTKLKILAQKQFFREKVMLEGVLMLHEGKSPLMIFDRLNAFQSDLNDNVPEMAKKTG